MTTSAPSFRSVDALSGDQVSSPVPAILAAADEIASAAAELEAVKAERDSLLARLDELDGPDAREQWARLMAENARLRRELAKAQRTGGW